MIRFYVARQRFDAYLLADRLNQAGIKAHVFNEHASSIVGDVPPDVAQPQVWLEREGDPERQGGTCFFNDKERRFLGRKSVVLGMTTNAKSTSSASRGRTPARRTRR